MSQRLPTLRVVLPLAAMAFLTLLTGCAPSEPVQATTSPTSGDSTSGINLNAPGPHQITVLILKANNNPAAATAGGPGVMHHDSVVVQIEPDPLNPAHYNVTHDRGKDKKVD